MMFMQTLRAAARPARNLTAMCAPAMLAALFQAQPLQAQPAAELVFVPISALHPTQAFISHDQIAYTLQRYRSEPQRLFADLCENRGQGDEALISAESVAHDADSFSCVGGLAPGMRPQDLKTAVRGPGGQLYLTDGHHTFSALYDYLPSEPELTVAVRVTHDRSGLDEPAFWQWMQENHLAWLRDAEGEPLAWQQMPARVGREHLGNDLYRGALYFLRDLVWQRPEPEMPFAEFYWAQHIRLQPYLQAPVLQTPAGEASALDWLRWLERIAAHMQALPADSAIGPQQQGPDAMGRLAVGQTRDLALLLCERTRPGRLMLALSVRGIGADCVDGSQLEHRPVLQQAPGELQATPQDVLALIEIPAGSNQKWQLDKSRPGLLEWEREADTEQAGLREIAYLPYPVNYGALPGTLAPRELGGDGDPLDVLVLGPALTPGALVPVRVLGTLRMLDDGEQDDKLLAVRIDDSLYAGVHSLADLEAGFPGITRILEIWFQHYKGARVTDLHWQEQQP